MAPSPGSGELSNSGQAGKSLIETLPHEILFMIGSLLAEPDPPPPFVRGFLPFIPIKSLLSLSACSRDFRNVFLPQFWKLAEWKGKVAPNYVKVRSVRIRTHDFPPLEARTAICTGFPSTLPSDRFANICKLELNCEDLGLLQPATPLVPFVPIVFQALKELTICCGGYQSIGFAPGMNFSLTRNGLNPWELELPSKESLESLWLARVDTMLPSLQMIRVNRQLCDEEEVVELMEVWDNSVPVSVDSLGDADIQVYVGVVNCFDLAAYFDRTIKYRDMLETLHEYDSELVAVILNLVKLKRSDATAWQVKVNKFTGLDDEPSPAADPEVKP